MKQKLLINLVLGLSFIVAACQHHSQSAIKSRPVEQMSSVVVFDSSMVFSHHMGKTAQNTAYLMLVLNDKGTGQLAVAAHDGRPYLIHFGGRMFTQSAQISSGFLVLSPVPQEWDAAHIRQLLPLP